MLIEVTEEDIEKGVAWDCSLCLIALALHRETGKKWEVFRSSARTVDGQWIDLPTRAQKFIVVFDVGVNMNPFSFEVDYEEV